MMHGSSTQNKPPNGFAPSQPAMKIDPILEELYAVRAEMMKQAGGDYLKLFADLQQKQSVHQATQTGVTWVDFSKPVANANASQRV